MRPGLVIINLGLAVLLSGCTFSSTFQNHSSNEASSRPRDSFSPSSTAPVFTRPPQTPPQSPISQALHPDTVLCACAHKLTGRPFERLSPRTRPKPSPRCAQRARFVRRVFNSQIAAPKASPLPAFARSPQERGQAATPNSSSVADKCAVRDSNPCFDLGKVKSYH